MRCRISSGACAPRRPRARTSWNSTSAFPCRHSVRPPLRAEEAEGKNFMELDIGLPVQELSEPLARALGGPTEPIEERVDAINRRGQPITCLVRVMALRTRANDIYGAMMLTAPVADGKVAPELAT